MLCIQAEFAQLPSQQTMLVLVYLSQNEVSVMV